MFILGIARGEHVSNTAIGKQISHQQEFAILDLCPTAGMTSRSSAGGILQISGSDHHYPRPDSFTGLFSGFVAALAS
jgi:hypothetical protein